MNCDKCLHEVAGRCRRHPKQPVAAFWTGAACGGKDQAHATAAELEDIANYAVIWAFPPADHPCGEFVQR